MEILDIIGNTPLLEMRRISPKSSVRIFAKLEGNNPTGSIKDRIVKAMLTDAELKGLIKPGDTIVEASSGNTGIALSMIATQKGYKTLIVIPREVPSSIGDLLKIYGADIHWCDSGGGMKNPIETARDIAFTNSYHLLGQFSNDINSNTHYLTTGREIVDQIGWVDTFIAGIGTGGTIMGVGKRLREINPNVRLIGVEPTLGDRLQGLRNLQDGYIPSLLNLNSIDSRFLVDSNTAIDTAGMITKYEGLFAGVSSGATMSVALRIAEEMDKGIIVVMFSDSGWKYLPSRPWEESVENMSNKNDIHWW
jgi:cysteine synthase